MEHGLTADDVADEPGTPPLQVTSTTVAKVLRSLPDIRAPGTLPEDNRVLKAIEQHGGVHGLTGMVNACLRDVGHERTRDMLAGHVRSALLQKRDPVEGCFLGWRPLGMTEKLRCLVWACVNAVKKVGFNRHFTNPLPEDVEARQVNIDNATAEVTKCELELDGARSSGCPTASSPAPPPPLPMPPPPLPSPPASSSMSPTGASPPKGLRLWRSWCVAGRRPARAGV